MTLNSAQKWLAFILLVVSLLGAAGSWLYLPKRMDAVELKAKDVEMRVSHDHDILIRIDTVVTRIEKQLERAGIVYDKNFVTSNIVSRRF